MSTRPNTAAVPAAPSPADDRDPWSTSRRTLLLVLSLSAVLMAACAVATPPGAAPDEGAHVHYVRRLITERRLPALNLAARRASHADPDYESHQPPLYYTLAVPAFAAGMALGGETVAVYGCRLLSILITLAGTALVFRLSRVLLPEAPWTAAGAAAFCAFLPMRVAVGASAGNDPLAEATASLVLLLLVRAIRGGPPLRLSASVRLGGVLGAAIGAAALSKQSAVLLLPPALAGIYLVHRPREAAKGAAGPAWVAGFVLCGGTLLLTLAVLAGWWFARNYLLYGDPLGQRVFNWYFEDTPRWAQFRDEMGWSFGRYLSQLVLPTSIATFWGAFGHLDPRRPDLFMGAYGSGAPGPHWGYPPRSWLYPLLLLAVVVSLAGWAAALVRRRAAPAPAPAGDAMTKAAAVPIWVHGVFVLAAYFNFNATYFQAQGRYLFPAIGGISMLLAGGWLALVPQRRRRAAVGVIALAMAALATYAVFGVIAPGFAK